MVVKVLLILFVSFMAFGLDGQTLTGPKHGKVVVCYLVSWAENRPNATEYTLEDMDPDLCTHIVYSFAGLNPYGNAIESLRASYDLEDYGGRGGYKHVVAYKERYPHLKVLLAFGGWNEGSIRYSELAASATKSAKFVSSVVEFLNLYHFDGLDLHWKYPTRNGGQPEDRYNVVLLAKELKNALEPHGLILTMATSAMKYAMDHAYDFVQLNNYVDYFHMLCYGYHGMWEGVVGVNAPLKNSKDTDIYTVDYTIKYMMSHGVSTSKMVLGLAAYGHTYQLKNPGADHVIFGTTPVQREGFIGPLTRVAGFMGYNEICVEKMNKSWSYHWHEQTLTPYLRDGRRIISYDNPRSIANKVKTAIDYGLAGLMLYSIDTDDFKGSCDKEPDTYVDFIERHKKIIDNPVMRDAVKSLELSDNNNRSLHTNTAYIISNGTLHLRLPETKYVKYPLMHTINEATTLALEEKRIMDEIKRIMREKDEPGSSGGLSSSFLSILFCSWLLIGFKIKFV